MQSQPILALREGILTTRLVTVIATKRRTNEDGGDRLGVPDPLQHPDVKMAQVSMNQVHCFLHLPSFVHGAAYGHETMLGNFFFPCRPSQEYHINPQSASRWAATL